MNRSTNINLKRWGKLKGIAVGFALLNLLVILPFELSIYFGIQPTALRWAAATPGALAWYFIVCPWIERKVKGTR